MEGEGRVLLGRGCLGAKTGLESHNIVKAPEADMSAQRRLPSSDSGLQATTGPGRLRHNNGRRGGRRG